MAGREAREEEVEEVDLAAEEEVVDLAAAAGEEEAQEAVEEEGNTMVQDSLRRSTPSSGT